MLGSAEWIEEISARRAAVRARHAAWLRGVVAAAGRGEPWAIRTLGRPELEPVSKRTVRPQTLSEPDHSDKSQNAGKTDERFANHAEIASYEISGSAQGSEIVMRPADMTARIARNLTKAREDAGLTQRQVAERLDPPVRHNEISRWEHGYVRPREPKLIQLAEICNRDPGWFYLEHASSDSRC